MRMTLGLAGVSPGRRRDEAKGVRAASKSCVFLSRELTDSHVRFGQSSRSAIVKRARIRDTDGVSRAGVSLPTWLLCLSLAVSVAFAACESSDAPRRAPLQVQPGWQTARQTPGHLVHVEQKQIPCDTCHVPNEQGSGLDRPVPERCVPCHTEQSTISHAKDAAIAAYGAGSPSDCMDCHRFVPVEQSGGPSEPARLHADRSIATLSDAGVAKRAAWQCERCHGLETGSAHSLQVHRFAECSKCHTPHGPRVAVPADCSDCHAKVTLTHGVHAKTDKACTGCHSEMHAGKQLARQSCGTCHGEGLQAVPVQAVFEGGHESCGSCHQAHQFDAEQAVTCTTCHQAKVTMAASKVKEHAACGNCHQAHDVTSAASSCNNCHARLDSDHPAAPNSSECGTCHRAHPVPGTAARAETEFVHSPSSTPCSDCHAQSMHDGVSHAVGVECTACHRPHQFDLKGEGRALCRRCHSNQTAMTATTMGHQECTSCHGGNVHLQRNPARACAECHQEQAERTRKGHDDCRTCHAEPHSATRVTSCRSCHEEQHRSAPFGHQDCASCHAPHESGRAPSATCASCHAPQTQGIHASTSGGCQDCHRAHGPDGQASPPTCSSCHAVQQLPALHTQRAHQDCGQCHSGHQKHIGDRRENCLGCHQAQRKTHYPDAPSCSSCHLFQAL